MHDVEVKNHPTRSGNRDEIVWKDHIYLNIYLRVYAEWPTNSSRVLKWTSADETANYFFQ